MKMPQGRSRVYLLPNVADARDRRIHQRKLFDLGGKLRRIGIGHHHPNVVADKTDISVTKASDELMDIDGGSLLVIATFLSRRLAESAQVRSDNCVVVAKVPKQRKPHSGVITEAVNQDKWRLAAAGFEVMNAHTIHICEK